MWNIDTFGHIKKRKDRILARINGIQKVLPHKFNLFLINLEKELQNELNEVLIQEEIFWFQKSRRQWLSQWDRNTKYYHLKTIVRRKKNKVSMLRNDRGDWVENIVDLKNMGLEYFIKEENASRPYFETSISFPTLTQENLNIIREDVKMEELKRALFSMNGYKAPGEDGYPNVFFQNNWDKVQQNMWTIVTNVVKGTLNLEEFN